MQVLLGNVIVHENKTLSCEGGEYIILQLIIGLDGESC